MIGGDRMASLLCTECFEYDCACVAPVRFLVDVGASVGSAVRAGRGTPVERAVADELVDPLDTPQEVGPSCPRCGDPVDPARWCCVSCGWAGFEKYPAA